MELKRHHNTHMQFKSQYYKIYYESLQNRYPNAIPYTDLC